MPKLTLEEKRRETLRRQLYGKEETSFKVSRKQEPSSKQENSKTYSMQDLSASAPHLPAGRQGSILLTPNYLKTDLTKVILFSTLAISIQLSLYFLLQNHIINLAF